MDKKRGLKKPEGYWDVVIKPKFGKIIAKSTKELKTNPDSSEAYYERGRAYWNLGEFDQAARDIEKVVKFNPGDLAKRRFLSRIYHDNGNSSKQITCANQILKIKPDARTYFLRGQSYYMKKKYTLAIADFNKSIKLKDPDDTLHWLGDAYHWLGDTYFELGKYSKGIASYREAIRLNPGSVLFYTALAMNCIKIKNYNEAINTITVRIKHKKADGPMGALLYVHRGLAYEEKGEYRKAINDFKKAIEFDPTFKGYRSNLNRVLQKAKLKTIP